MRKLFIVVIVFVMSLVGLSAGRYAFVDPLTPPMQAGDVLELSPKMALMIIQQAASGASGSIYMQSPDGKLMFFAKYLQGCQGWGFVVAGNHIGAADMIKQAGGNFTSAQSVSDVTKFLKDQGWITISGSQAAWAAIAAQISYGSIFATPFLLPITPDMFVEPIRIDS